MHSELRRRYNAAFTGEKYKAFLETMNTAYGEPVTFRISETPVFVPAYLRDKLFRGVEDICEVIRDPGYLAKTEASIPSGLRVPNEDSHTVFLQLDFGICRGEDGTLTPQLIEMQGFPSLYLFQHLLASSYRAHFDIPSEWNHLFGGLDEASYIAVLRDIIIGDSRPENTVLLELEPRKQNTRVDFWGTREHLGVKVLCLSEVKREGRDLYYFDESGRRVLIERIYNRIIFDELDRRSDLPREWNLTEEVNARWVGHPNWFFRISKYALPFMKSEFVPETHFLSDLREIPKDLDQWVLKPLFSFSGQGVLINVTAADIRAVKDPSDYILQRKVAYVPGVETLDPGDPAKCEIRMMLLWNPKWEGPRLVNNLVRMSKGEMVGVRYNMGKDWVGASVGFFEPIVF